MKQGSAACENTRLNFFEKSRNQVLTNQAWFGILSKLSLRQELRQKPILKKIKKMVDKQKRKCYPLKVAADAEWTGKTSKTFEKST